MAAFFQSMTSEKGSSHPLLRMTGMHAACEEIQRKGPEEQQELTCWELGKNSGEGMLMAWR